MVIEYELAARQMMKILRLHHRWATRRVDRSRESRVRRDGPNRRRGIVRVDEDLLKPPVRARDLEAWGTESGPSHSPPADCEPARGDRDVAASLFCTVPVLKVRRRRGRRLMQAITNLLRRRSPLYAFTGEGWRCSGSSALRRGTPRRSASGAGAFADNVRAQLRAAEELGGRRASARGCSGVVKSPGGPDGSACGPPFWKRKRRFASGHEVISWSATPRRPAAARTWSALAGTVFGPLSKRKPSTSCSRRHRRPGARPPGSGRTGRAHGARARRRERSTRRRTTIASVKRPRSEAPPVCRVVKESSRRSRCRSVARAPDPSCIYRTPRRRFASASARSRSGAAPARRR